MAGELWRAGGARSRLRWLPGCSPHGNASWRWLCHGPCAEGLRGESAGASGTSLSPAAARAAGTAPCTASRFPAPIPALLGCTNTLLCLCPSWVPLLLPSAPELGVCSQRLPSALAPQARAPALVSEGSGHPWAPLPALGHVAQDLWWLPAGRDVAQTPQSPSAGAGPQVGGAMPGTALHGASSSGAAAPRPVFARVGFVPTTRQPVLRRLLFAQQENTSSATAGEG